MSRVAKMPITLPEGASAAIKDGQVEGQGAARGSGASRAFTGYAGKRSGCIDRQADYAEP